MNNTEIKKKVRSQKYAAIFLIVGPAIVLLRTLIKNNFELSAWTDYVSAAALLVIMLCGFSGLRNSLRKEKELKHESV